MIEAASLDQAAILAAIQRPTDVVLQADLRDDGCWTVTICMADTVGALAILAGLFAAYQLDIINGDLYTVRRPADPPPHRRPGRRPPPPRPSRLLLDVFEIRSLAGGEAPWTRLHDDLRSLVGLLSNGQWEAARDAIIDRVADIFVSDDSETRLLPVAIDVVTDPGEPLSRLTVHSTDTPGFLFAFTNALAGFTINIERATIRTTDAEAIDTFWVTDVAGQPITGEKVHDLRAATALIKQFTHLLPRSPNPGQALRQFGALIHQMLSRPQWTQDIADLSSPAVLEAFADLMGVSRFLWEDFLRLQHENLFPLVVDLPALGQPHLPAAMRAELLSQLAAAPDFAGQLEVLNRFKDREMFRVDLRHITGRSSYAAFSHELSALADLLLDVAADCCYADLVRQHGVPILPNGRTCRWSVCALGKFGGGELGFGSDLEILVVYEGEGTTNGATPIVNSQLFASLVQSLLRALHARQEGIFEIDLRLRPYGKAGALATSFDGFTHYYSEAGPAEQFERMSLVKLRPVAGDGDLGARIIGARDAYVYAPRPLDLNNVLHLRHRQATELVPAGKISAKHSPGGVVDVEYFIQVRQIAVGYLDRRVRVTNTLDAIHRLESGGYLDPALVAEIIVTYQFLRQLIDALRVVRGNAKDLTIPHETTREFAYLAGRLGYAAPADLVRAIDQQMAFARSIWQAGLDHSSL